MSKVLLLNATDEPIHICSWRKALLMLLKGKASCIGTIESINALDELVSQNNSTRPGVIKLNYEVAVSEKKLPFCRENILIRDNYTCQYCGQKFAARELTLDHVYPKSRLGPDIWENIVACCKECNGYKANRTPKEAGMRLIRRPFRPDGYMEFELQKHSDANIYEWSKYFKAS